MFSNLSSNSISLAMLTPSFVINGLPYSFSNTTLRPFGPSVTRTAFASVLTPFNIDSRASFEKRTSFAIMYILLYLLTAIISSSLITTNSSSSNLIFVPAYSRNNTLSPAL